MDPYRTRFSRREALQRLGAGSLITLGLWPGVLRAGDRGGGGSFRFLVVNDTHYVDKACGVWLENVVRRMKAEEARFCLAAGDLANDGGASQLAGLRDSLWALGIPVYVQLGNHDYAGQTDRGAYEKLFPDRLNYWFEHSGWQFVGLDTTEGQKWEKTQIGAETLRWCDDNLRRLDRLKPTVIFTHFPLGGGVTYRPLNADALLDRFRDFNLQAAFSGHFHGFTEHRWREATLTTNRCCALKRANHDGTPEKGYFVCEAKDGRITRRFVQVNPAA